jgi:hypothetical protein
MIKYHLVIGVFTLTTISLLNGLALMASSDNCGTWYILVILWYWVLIKSMDMLLYIHRAWNDPCYILWLLHIVLRSFHIWTSPRLGFVATQNPKPKSTQIEWVLGSYWILTWLSTWLSSQLLITYQLVLDPKNLCNPKKIQKKKPM